jgi:Antirepressor regulating drug resistance, predicted signal transduction N-terminal membrane component
MNLNLAVSPGIHGLSNATGILIQGEVVAGKPVTFLTFQTTLIILYIIISSVLLLRFALNIYKIIRLIRTSAIVDNQKTQIVLVENVTLPFSFFRYIFVNRSDYENGKIEKELLIHEQAHCTQYHSIDILAVELIKIILWFNPFVWFFSKAIQLNHEYLADNEVLSNHDVHDYQNTLINIVFRNNSTYLASNFNYSLTKKRLIMMTNNNSLRKAIYLKIAAVPLFLILAITLTFSQENKNQKTVVNFENEWWYQILKKHHLEVQPFNNFERVFEMGTKNTINNRMVTLENAFFLIKTNNDEYFILKSPLAYHDLDKNIITCDKGTMETYKIKSEDTESFEKRSFDKLKLQITDGNPKYEAESVSGMTKTKK